MTIDCFVKGVVGLNFILPVAVLGILLGLQSFENLVLKYTGHPSSHWGLASIHHQASLLAFRNFVRFGVFLFICGISVVILGDRLN